MPCLIVLFLAGVAYAALVIFVLLFDVFMSFCGLPVPDCLEFNW